MPFVQGFLKIRGAGHVDNELPGVEGPTDPGYGISIDRPDNTLPDPPGVWPPPSLGRPIVPVDPGFGGGIPVQPGTIWPTPGRPPHVDAGLPPGGHVDAGLPTPPSGTLPARPPVRPDAGLPGGQGGTIDNTLPSKVFWMLCYCPSLGWKFIAVDPSLTVGTPLPPAPAPK